MAVTANDSVDAIRSHCQIGVDIGIHFDTGRVLSETDMGDGNDDIIGGIKSCGKLLRLGDRVTEGQAGDVAGQFIIRDAMVANPQDGNINVTLVTT